MNTILILFAQTKGGATIEILSMLLGAAIIGYITAWLYYRSVYESRIKIIESEKQELNNRIKIIESENNKLNNRNKVIESENKELNERIKTIESDKHELNNRIVNLDGIIVDLNKRISDKDKEMEKLILAQISQRKHLLDYNSFGTAIEAEKDDLKMISGIGPFIEERLHAVDIYTFRQIGKFTARDIETINVAIVYFAGRIERDEWVAQAKELVHNQDERAALLKRISDRKATFYYDRIGIAKKEEADDLTVISGIGGWIKEKLNVLDIYTFRQISNFTKEDVQAVTEAIEYFPGRIERDEWILQARDLVRIAGNKAELLKRIRERKESIYYDRLGFAHKHEANNLTLIDGLGLWVEERLNTLDIYTFDQISKLTHKDIETITEVLELIPGRIEEDNWVAQARVLAKKQQEKEMI
jgi:predicted flap endonuclease-1-like 5' DNA nuclease/archaellum component FlaF (FlaF/FlaG flagellin family)